MGYSTCTISIYLESKSSLLEKIQAINALIDSMFTRLAESAAGTAATVDEYWMDDGQMKVKTSYRSIDDIQKGVKALEILKQQYVNRYNGRGLVLRDTRGINC